MRRALLLLLLYGCPHDPDFYAWDRLMDQVNADGSVSLKTALQAFSLAIAPLPGVAIPEGKPKNIPCGTLPIQWVYAHWSELTTEQQVAVEQALHGSVALLDTASVPTVSELQMKVDAAKVTVAGLLGQPIPFISVSMAPQPGGNLAKAAAGTYAYDDMHNQVGPATQFEIAFWPVGLNLSSDDIDEAVYHEVFHCFMYKMFPSIPVANQAPGWIMEGAAMWAGATLAAHGGIAKGYWTDYLTNPKGSLFRRNYDAVGFYAQINQSGRVPWKFFADQVTAWVTGGNDSAFRSITGSEAFLDRWATGWARNPALGAEWDMTGPEITNDRPELPRLPVGNGGRAHDGLVAGGNKVYLVSLTADVVMMRTPVHSRLRSSSSGGANPPLGNFCMLPGGCTCPRGSLREGEVLGSLTTGDYYLAVTGALTGVPDWVMSGKDLDTFCYCDIIDPCVLGTWTVLSSSAAAAVSGMMCTWPDPWGAIFTVDKKGNFTEDFSSVPPVPCKSGADDVVLQFGGQSFGKMAWADHGFAKGTGDISGLTIQETINGVDVGTFPLGWLADPSLLASTSFDSYTCAMNNMSFTTSTGNVITLSR